MFTTFVWLTIEASGGVEPGNYVCSETVQIVANFTDVLNQFFCEFHGIMSSVFSPTELT